MIDTAYEQTLKLILDKREQVTQVAQMLMDRETISNLDIAEVIGARPYSAGKEYDSYVNSSNWKRTEKHHQEKQDPMPTEVQVQGV